MCSTRSPFRREPAAEAGAAVAWGSAGLLLVGHGSSDLEIATESLQRHAAALRARGLFAAVEAGFLRGSPGAGEALARLDMPDLYVVPFFLGEGYFSEVAVPRRLGLTKAVTVQSGSAAIRTLRYCRPVGCSPRVVDALADVGRRACAAEGLDPQGTTLLVVGHGNEHSGASSRMLRRHADTLAAAGRFRAVVIAFIEEPPLLADALRAAAGGNTVVVGALAGLGHHALDDIPDAVAAERDRCGGRGAALVYAGIIGSEPLLADLILESVRAFDEGEPGRVMVALRQPQPAT